MKQNFTYTNLVERFDMSSNQYKTKLRESRMNSQPFCSQHQIHRKFHEKKTKKQFYTDHTKNPKKKLLSNTKKKSRSFSLYSMCPEYELKQKNWL